MKKYILLFLVLTSVSSAQFPLVAAWQSGSAQSFSPADIDSLADWYVVADLADSLGKSDGDTTYILPNRGGFLSPYSHGPMYQTTNSKKPVFKADSNVLVFDPVDDNMVSGATDLAQPNTIFIAVRIPAPGKSGTHFIYDGTNVAKRHSLYKTATTLHNNAFAGLVLSTGQTLTDSVYVFTTRYNGATSDMRRNGILTASGNTGAQPMGDLVINSVQALNSYYGVNLREIVVYNGLLTDAEVGQVEFYIATKYGITLP